jgi:ankyrin repeat protein
MLISLLLLLFVSQLSGCGPLAMQANDDRRVKFDNYFTEPFSARNQPAAATREEDRDLLKKGYAKIGKLEVQRVTERCIPSDKKQACTPVPHTADAAAEFLLESAALGGDLVVLERTQEPGTEPYSKRGKCIDWQEVLQYESQIRYETAYDRSVNRVTTRMVPSMKLVPKEQCARYETLEGKAAISTTAGSIWRLERDLSMSQQLNQKFLYAAALGRTDEVKRYIAQGLDLNTRNTNGDLVLGIAAVYGHRGVIAALLDAGADVNAADLNGTALHRAAANGNLDIVKLLIERKADVNVKMPFGRHKGATPLFDAARSGNGELVRYLLARSATADAPTENGVTPLMIASMEGHADVIDALVGSGAFVNATSKPIFDLTRKTTWTGGWTPLMLSVFRQKHEAQMVLIADGAMITTEAVELGKRLAPLDVPARSQKILDLGWKLAWAKRSWGYIDNTGKFVIPPRFAKVEPFSEGLAAVCEHGKGTMNHCGYINASGAFVIPPKYYATASFSEGLGAVDVYFDKKDPGTGIFGACGYVDRTGKAVIPLQFANCGKFSEGLAGVTIAGFKFGYIDKEGRWVIPPNMQGSPQPFTGGFAQVWVQGIFSGEYKWIDRSGNIVPVDPNTVTKAAAQAGAGKSKDAATTAKLRPTPFRTQGFPKSPAWHYVDAAGTVKAPGPFTTAHLFAEGLASVEVYAPESEPLVSQWAALWAEVTRGGNFLQAARKGDIESMEKLLKQGADVNAADTQGMTPLLFAAANDHVKAVKFLLDKGADVKAQDSRGYTALMLVAGSGNVELAQLLVKSGSNLHARNDLGLTAAELAELQGDAMIGKLLRKTARP